MFEKQRKYSLAVNVKLSQLSRALAQGSLLSLLRPSLPTAPPPPRRQTLSQPLAYLRNVKIR